LANIRTEHFQNKILERYSQTSLVGNWILCEGNEPLPITVMNVFIFFKLVGWDFGYWGHYWPIVRAPDDR
jgi:hypothetical protein